MNIYLLIPLIEVIFCLALLIILMISGRRHIARRPFSLFLIFMTLWGFFIFMMRASADMSAALFWEKFVFGAILSASLFFYRFAIAFTGARPERFYVSALYFLFCGSGSDSDGAGGQWHADDVVWQSPRHRAFFLTLCSMRLRCPSCCSCRMLIRHRRHTRVIDERVRDQYIIAGYCRHVYRCHYRLPAGPGRKYVSARHHRQYPLLRDSYYRHAEIQSPGDESGAP